MGKRLVTCIVVCAAVLLTACLPISPASAAMITYITPGGANIGGEPVDAKAEFITSTDSVTVKLTNFQADPNSVKQVITGIFFEISSGQDAGTLDTITGTERTVNGDDTFADGGAVTSGWVLTQPSVGELLIDILNNPGQPKFGVIGPANDVTGEYNDAGGSIAGNNPHNPFTNQIIEFELTITGVTAASMIDSATFQFNTAAGDNVSGIVPEPASFALLVGGVATMALRRRR